MKALRNLLHHEEPDKVTRRTVATRESGRPLRSPHQRLTKPESACSLRIPANYPVEHQEKFIVK
jgi:hypothetical protein